MEKRLRICMIAFLFAPHVGGAETRTENQARQLQALGHKVTILTLRLQRSWPVRENYDGLPVIRIGGIFKRDGTLRRGRLGHLPITLLTFLTLWHMRKQYDLLHALQISSLAGVAALISKLVRKPVIVSIPSAGPGRVQSKEQATLMADTLEEKGLDTGFLRVPYTDINVGDLSSLAQTALGGQAILDYLKRSDVFYQVLSSRSEADLLARGFRADRITCIPNGVDTEHFCPDPLQRPDPERSERDIVCVARLEFPKGIDVLLHAWKRMLDAPTQWRSDLKPRLLIAGGGSLQPQLERLAHELEIEDTVLFLGSRNNVISLLQQGWGFVLPSRWEGMPNALLEAMSCGTPCIATRVSGSEDIVEDGRNALLVEPENPRALAQALHILIENAPLAARLAIEGRNTVLLSYRLSHITDRMLALYHLALQHAKEHTPENDQQTAYLHRHFNLFPLRRGSRNADISAVSATSLSRLRRESRHLLP